MPTVKIIIRRRVNHFLQLFIIKRNSFMPKLIILSLIVKCNY
nr:MAG TPA: hypothetical protein [Caudoviricetes sp.]DAT20581.1 MAG TPA: hypothetical protein [Caudoviricetes sp.]